MGVPPKWKAHEYTPADGLELCSFLVNYQLKQFEQNQRREKKIKSDFFFKKATIPGTHGISWYKI